MDSFYPQVEMVLVEDVNDIIDPLENADIDADIPAIKLELDDDVDSDEEFRLTEIDSYDIKEACERIKRESAQSSDAAEPFPGNTLWDDSDSSDHFIDSHDTKQETQSDADEKESIRTQMNKETAEPEAVKSEVDAAMEKIRVSLQRVSNNQSDENSTKYSLPKIRERSGQNQRTSQNGVD